MPKQLPTMPKRFPNESPNDWNKRIKEWKNEPVRSKGDLKSFKCGDFSLNKEPKNA